MSELKLHALYWLQFFAWHLVSRWGWHLPSRIFGKWYLREYKRINPGPNYLVDLRLAKLESPTPTPPQHLEPKG